MTPVELLGHGIGGRLDLPIPVSYFAAAAGVIIIVTFAGLAVLWPHPRLQDGPRSRTLTWGPPVGWLGAVGVAGLLLAIGGGLATWLGNSIGSRSLAPLLLWVVFWLLVPFAGVFLGNLYTGLNPWRALSTWLGIGARERSGIERRVGVWPAVAALFAFTGLELIYPDSGAPSTVGVAALMYSIYLLVLMSRLGVDTGLTVGDAFTAYNRLFSSISPFGRDREGRLLWRGWLRALPVLPEWRGLAPFIIVMIGTVSYDGLSATDWWGQATGVLGASVGGGLILMALVVAVIGGGYYLACFLASRTAHQNPPSVVASRFAHTLVPIAFAYAFAHYFTLILFEGQQLISSVSDPFGLGWDLFGTAGYKINFFLGTASIWYVQVGTIVIGHLAGVVLAHDRALADFRGMAAVRSQYPMLILMVLLTMLGLFILAG